MDALVEEAEIDLGPLGETLGFLLRLAQLGAFDAFRARLGDAGLHPGAFSVLVLVALNPGVRQGAVAERLRIKRAHMTKLVRVMGEAGLVQRRVPEHDRRSVELTLTEAGRERVDRTLPEMLAAERQAAGALSPAEVAALARLLRKYVGLGGQT